MKKVHESILRFFEGTIKYISLVTLVLMLFMCTFYQNNISFDILEKCTVVPNGPFFFVVLILSIPAFYGVYKLLKIIPENVLFIVFTTLYLITGIYMITHIQMQPRHDSGFCYWNALNYLEGTFSSLQPGEYFSQYPHQLGLVLYNSILFTINKNVNILFFANLFWILLTNFFLWRSARLYFEKESLRTKLIILITFCFLPHLFYLFFAYGQVPGLAFLSGALFFTLKYFKQDKKWCFAISALLLALACLVRTNYLIGATALIIVFLIKTLKEKKPLFLIAIPIFLLCATVPSKIVISGYENVASVSLDNAQPYILHVAMGLQEQVDKDIWRASGWFNNYNDDIYYMYDYDVNLCTEIALESIQERLYTFASDPKYAFSFFKEKLLTTWCEPLYQSIWSGPLISLGHPTESSLLTNLYSGGSVFTTLASLMNILNIMIFGFSLLFVIKKTFISKDFFNAYELFSLLFFLGGFFFHLVWETKCQYVYPNVLLLIPFACSGMFYFFSLADEWIKKLQKK